MLHFGSDVGRHTGSGHQHDLKLDVTANLRGLLSV